MVPSTGLGPLWLFLFVLAAVGAQSARLDSGYGYKPPRPAPLYETPSTPKPLPPRPYRSSTTRPRPPTPRPYQPPAKRPTPPPPTLPPYRPPQTKPPIVSAPSKNYPVNQEPQMPYQFEWGVEDSESGNSFSHVETNDGKKTEGEYRVLLPDGRTQVVKFYDDGWGFVADVSFE